MKLYRRLPLNFLVLLVLMPSAAAAVADERLMEFDLAAGNELKSSKNWKQ